MNPAFAPTWLKLARAFRRLKLFVRENTSIGDFG
jgi:hypothetical protein